MATSDPAGGGPGGGFWSGPLGGFLVSRGNLVGLVLAVAAVAVHLTVGLGAFWPVVVAASWAIGPVLMPARRPQQLLLGATGQPGTLVPMLAALRRRAAAPGGLPPQLGQELEDLAGTLTGILDQWEALATGPQQRQVVEAMILDYLPHAVDTYLDIPPTARGIAVSGVGTANDALSEQLALLQQEAGRIEQAIVADAVGRLGVQNRFLEEKFASTGLDELRALVQRPGSEPGPDTGGPGTAPGGDRPRMVP